jgi:hypothetical protein
MLADKAMEMIGIMTNNENRLGINNLFTSQNTAYPSFC